MESIKKTEVCKRMLLKYGKHCTAQKNVYEWVNRFKRGGKTFDDKERSGLPWMSLMDYHCAEVAQGLKETDELLYVKLHSLWTLVMDQHSPFSTATLAATKSVQDGYHNSKCRNTKISIYGYLNISCRDTTEEERICCNDLSQVMKHGSIIMNHDLNDRSEGKHSTSPMTKS
jgi:hypothetical protein